MTTHSRRLLPFTALLAVSGLLTACGSDSTSTSQPEPTASTVTVTETPEPADAPEQQQLTEKQIRAALPTTKEAPKGFVRDPNVVAVSDSTRVIDPDECRAIYLDTDEIRTWVKEHHSAAGAVRYTQKGDAAGRPSVSVFVTSFDVPIPKEYFDDAGAALGDCATFTEKNSPTDNPLDKKASNITAPVVGDQSYAHRVGMAELDLTIDQLWVRSGHNLINIRVLTGYSEYSDETLGDLVEGVLEDLGG